MPSEALTVLLVEDDMIIGSHIAVLLTDHGYLVSAILPSGEQALQQIAQVPPDLVLMDIQLKGQLDGIETAKQINRDFQIPIIFLTANSDQATFNRAKGAFPHAFIPKPFQPDELIRALEIIGNRLDKSALQGHSLNKHSLNDRIFVRDKQRMVKLQLADIQYVQAERSYCNVVTAEKTYTLSMPLKAFEEEIKTNLFCRIHRSYLVNLKQLIELDEHYVFFGKVSIPISKSYKPELTKRLRLL